MPGRQPADVDVLGAEAGQRGGHELTAGAVPERRISSSQPRAGTELGVAPSWRHVALAAVTARVGAEVADVRADPPQRRQRVADPLVVHRALAVDGEAVAAHPVLGGAGLDAREVHRPGGELGEDLEQRAGVVLPQVGDERGAVVAGRRRRRDGPGEQDEAGDRTGVVGDVVRERVQAVQLARDRWGDGGVEAASGDRLRPARGRADERDLRAGQVRPEPAPGLRLGVRVRGDALYGVLRRARPGEDVEHHRQVGLGGDDQRGTAGQLVQGGRHRALDGVLQRDDGGLHQPVAQGVQRLGDGGGGHLVGAVQLREVADRGMGERPGRTEEADPGHGATVPARRGVSPRGGGRAGRRVSPAVPAAAQRGVDRLLLLRRQLVLAAAGADALGVDAGAAARGDRAERHTVAGVVQQRDGERQPPRQVVEGVVADQRDVAQPAFGVGAHAVEPAPQRGQLPAERGQVARDLGPVGGGRGAGGERRERGELRPQRDDLLGERFGALGVPFGGLEDRLVPVTAAGQDRRRPAQPRQRAQREVRRHQGQVGQDEREHGDVRRDGRHRRSG